MNRFQRLNQTKYTTYRLVKSLNSQSHIISILLQALNLLKSRTQYINTTIKIHETIKLTVQIFLLKTIDSFLYFTDNLFIEHSRFVQLQYTIFSVKMLDEILQLALFYTPDLQFNYIASSKLISNVLRTSKTLKDATLYHNTHFSA